MGNLCEPATLNDANADVDLPELSTLGVSDRYQLWEYKTAFSVTPFVKFKQSVDQAEISSGGDGFVTLDALAE